MEGSKNNYLTFSDRSRGIRLQQKLSDSSKVPVPPGYILHSQIEGATSLLISVRKGQGLTSYASCVCVCVHPTGGEKFVFLTLLFCSVSVCQDPLDLCHIPIKESGGPVASAASLVPQLRQELPPNPDPRVF